ncbi:hypothetical protein KKD52_04015 [Myxococcota bacterium]|nr:hypothetical protein [Myxococcota bacterium]MBU1509507.1 hypothetical protein [Myxococcota bacterium]
MMRASLLCMGIIVASLLNGCDDGGQKTTHGTPVAATDWTYRLSESPSGIQLWTAPAARRVRSGDRAPVEARSGLFASAARREREVVQLIVDPGAGGVALAPLSDTALASVELFSGGLTDGHLQTLTPLPWNQAASGGSGAPVVLWLVLTVAEDAPAGERTLQVELTVGGQALTVPLRLYVFDFELPPEIHYESLLYLSVADLIGPGETEETVKNRLFDLRMTPASVAWPSGLTYRITWDSEANPQRCSAFYDEPDENPAYAVGALAPKYMLGEGWNGIGFPNSMFFQFVDNSTPRPDSFCGESRGDHFGSAAYNEQWSAFLTGLEGYLDAAGLLTRGYWYVQNEPQDQADYDVAAHLCRMARAAAPGLRIAVSEEPKPEIAEHADGACMYDLWIAHIRALEPVYAAEALRQGASLWIYTLDHDPDPYFNPTRPDADGMHMRIIPWVSWTSRATGWAYYDFGRFFDGPRATYMAHLFREASEDFEYLRLAAGGSGPTVDVDTPADVTARSVAASPTSWTRDPDAFMTVRHELGRYVEGTRAEPPVLSAPGSRPRGVYCVNFQDPAGAPAQAVELGGVTCEKVGWPAFDVNAGLGWYGEFVGNPGITLTGYDDVAGVSEALRSYVYDDYGRENLFEFSLENGRYRVTVGAGRPARAYPNDPHRVMVEGTQLIDDEPTTDAQRTFERSIDVELSDGSLSMVMGGQSALTGEFAYTFLSYLLIEPLP